MAIDWNLWPVQAENERKAFQQYFKRLRRKPPRQLDEVMAGLHEEVFNEIDCLTCANCCKTTSPIFRDKDIERIARHLGMRPAEMVQRYLHIDEDGDYVLHEAPCTFLGADNYCTIYDVRPKACRDYPHTDRKNFHQILDLTLKNTQICPAAFEIVKRLRNAIPGGKVKGPKDKGPKDKGLKDKGLKHATTKAWDKGLKDKVCHDEGVGGKVKG